MAKVVIARAHRRVRAVLHGDLARPGREHRRRRMAHDGEHRPRHRALRQQARVPDTVVPAFLPLGATGAGRRAASTGSCCCARRGGLTAVLLTVLLVAAWIRPDRFAWLFVLAAASCSPCAGASGAPSGSATGKRIIHVQGTVETTASEARCGVDRVSGVRSSRPCPARCSATRRSSSRRRATIPACSRLERLGNAERVLPRAARRRVRRAPTAIPTTEPAGLDAYVTAPIPSLAPPPPARPRPPQLPHGAPRRRPARRRPSLPSRRLNPGLRERRTRLPAGRAHRPRCNRPCASTCTPTAPPRTAPTPRPSSCARPPPPGWTSSPSPTTTPPAGWDEALAARPAGLTVVRGVEFSCVHSGGDGRRISLHLLAYLVDPRDAAIQAEWERLRDGPASPRAADGRARSPPTATRSAGSRSAGWPPAGRSAGRTSAGRWSSPASCPTCRRAFADLLSSRRPYYVRKPDTDVFDAIRLVRGAGGLPVFAHPLARRRGPVVDDEVIAAMARGRHGRARGRPPRPRRRRPRARRRPGRASSACSVPARRTTTAPTSRRRSAPA